MDAARQAFVAHLEAIRRSPKTVEAYEIATAKLTRFCASRGYALTTMPPRTLSEFAAHLSSAEGLAASSVHLYVTGASQFLKWCRQHGYPVADMVQPSLPRIREPLPVVLKEKALATYVRVAQSVVEPYRTALLLLPMSGLRIGEMCRLELSDVDITPPWIRFRIRNGKSKRDRVVPVLKEGKPLVARYLAQVRPTLPGDHWLFPNRDGRPITTRMLQKHFRKVRGELGIHDLTPHKLRHTYLTTLNEHGITGFDLAEIAGHKNLSTTRLYVHPSSDELSRRVEQIETHWTTQA